MMMGRWLVLDARFQLCGAFGLVPLLLHFSYELSLKASMTR